MHSLNTAWNLLGLKVHMQLFTFFAPLSVQMPIEGMVMSTTTKICFDGPWIFTTVKIIHKVWNSILLLLLFPISLLVQFWILSRNAYFSTFVWNEDQIENPFEIKSLLPSEILAMILIEEDSFHHVKMWGKLNTHSYSDYGFLSLSWKPFWIRVSFSCSSKYTVARYVSINIYGIKSILEFWNN